MKSLRMLAAITLAAMMVVCVGAVAFDATDSDADGSSSSASMTPQEIANLTNLLNYSAHDATAEPITSDYVVASGQVLFLDKNFTFSEGVKLTVQDGAAIAFCPLQPFSFVGTNMFLDMEEGSSFAIVCGEVTNFADVEDKEIFINENEYDEFYKFNGTITNVATKLSPTDKLGFTLTMGAGATMSEVEYTDPTEVNSTTTFNTDNKIEVKLEKFDLAAMNIDISVNVAVDATNDSIEEKVKVAVKGAPSYAVKVGVADSTLTAKITGTGEITGDLYKTDETPEKKMATFTYSNRIDADARITDYGDETKAKMYFDGSAEVNFEVTDIYYEEIEEGVTVMVGELSGVYANMSMGFRGDEVTISAEAGLGYFAMSDNNRGTTDLMKQTEIEDINASIEYRVKSADPVAAALSVPTIGTGSLSASAPSPSSIIKTMAKAYFAGMPKEDFNVREYAKEFFFGQVGGYLPVSTDEMVSDYLYADFEIGKIFVANQVDAEGISGSAEISDSVGARVEANIDKFYLYQGEQTVMIKPVNVTIQTSDDPTEFLELYVYATAEVKTYDDGVLDADVFVEALDLNASVRQNDKVADGVEYALKELSVKRIGIGNDGIFQVINDARYNVDDKQIEAGTMSIWGDYYGPANIRSIDGTISDIVMPFDISTSSLTAVAPSSTVTIGSADFTVYDIYGNSIRVTRNYDAQKAVINDKFTVDGQVWFGDVLSPVSPVNGILKMQFTNQAATAKTHAEIEGVLITNGLYVASESPSPPLMDNKAFSLTAGGLQIFDGTTAPQYTADTFIGAIYASPMLSEGNNNGTAPVTLYTEEILVKTYGSSIGFFVDSDGKVTYELRAMPEYKIDAETGNPEGFTIDSSNDESAKITRTGTTLGYSAVPATFLVIVDGKVLMEDAKYNQSFTVAVGKVSFIYDENGRVLAPTYTSTLVDGNWTFTRTRGTGDLEVSTATFTPYTGEIKSTEVNKIDADSVQFTFGGGASGTYAFALNSGVRFDVTGAASKEVSFVAKETKFNGYKAFVIKAMTNGGANLPATLYLPVGGEGQKVMHVDDYGRAQEIKSTYRLIDGQAYQVVSVSDYSIFYTTEDVPNFDGSGSDKNNNLLYIGIAVVVAIVALAGVAYFLKTKQSAA